MPVDQLVTEGTVRAHAPAGHRRPAGSSPASASPGEGEPGAGLGGTRPRAWAVALLCATPLVALVVGFESLRVSDPRDIGDYGLITALRPGYFAALVVLTLGFVVHLRHGRVLPWLGLLYVVALTALLDGAPFVIEGAPRFPVTFVHAGFAEAIMRTGETLTTLDARFSWPGFFSLFGYLSTAAGLPDTMPLAVWFPFLAKALWLCAIWVVLRWLFQDVAVCWLALWLFQLIEWSGQSYYSPQAVGFLVYMVCVAVLVVVMDPRHEPGPVDRVTLGVAILTFAALVVTHQLSPFMVMAAAGLLGVLAMTRARSLWVLFGTMFVVWFSFGTVDYWIGHIGNLVGDAGNVSDNLNDNVGERLRGNVAHERVVYSRMAVSAVSGVLAGLGVVLAWRLRRLDRRIIVLGVAPLGSLALQSYGGEGLIRAFLFVLPIAAGAAAFLFLPHPDRPPRAASIVALGVLLVALLPVALLAKYGGESYESVTAAERRTADWVHEHVRPGDLVASIAPAGLLRSRHVGEVDYVPALDDFQTGDLRSVRRLMAEYDGRALLVLTDSQFGYGYNVSGLEKGWEDELLAQLEESRQFRLLHRDGRNVVYVLEGPRHVSAR